MNSKSILIFIILIMYFFFLCSCIKKKEKVIPVPKPSHIPESAFQATNTESDWFYIDNSIGYYATWDKYGTLLTEIFLVNNLTEKIIKYYHDNGRPRRISTFKSFNNQKIPEDTIELAESEPENYKQRSEIKHLPNKFYTMNNNILHHLYPRAYFGILVWDSGPDYVFAQGKVYSKECWTVKGKSYESPVEKCGSKTIYSLDGKVENTHYPLKCNHSCSDKIVSLRKGKYRISSLIEAPVFSKQGNNFIQMGTIKEDETVEVLGEQIDIPEINLENFSWIKIKSKAIVGYIKKSNLTNKPVN